MSFRAKDTGIYREDEKSGHSLLPAKQREELVNRYLPKPPSRSNSRRRRRQEQESSSRLGIRKLIRQQLYALSYTLIHAIFSVYIRLRVAYHAVTHRFMSILRYHHRTPDYIQRDVRALKRMPHHVSVILSLEDEGKQRDAIDKLTNEVADIAAWCASADIPFLSVYERSGVLKNHMPRTHQLVTGKLQDWFGRFQAPDLHLHCRGEEPIHPPNYHAPGNKVAHGNGIGPTGPRLEMLLISQDDGRESMVDLTRVFTVMAQRSKVLPADITTDVIDNELSQAVMAEPDLLISFAPYVDLQGYPPWQIRLTEIFHVQDNEGVGYQVFLAALRSYSAATFKLGK